MNAISVIGIDPGPSTGILTASWQPGERAAVMVRAFQCDAGTARLLLIMILDHPSAGVIHGGGIEQFVSRRRSVHLAGTHADITCGLIPDLLNLAGTRGISLSVRPAATVKPWATERRLELAGLMAATAGLPHARSAAQQALYCAVHDGGLPDPLSRKIPERGSP